MKNSSQNGKRKGHVLVSDEIPLTLAALARLTGYSSWSIYRFKSEGYEFEFGRRTSAKHFLSWLRGRAPRLEEEKVEKREYDNDRLEKEMARLRRNSFPQQPPPPRRSKN